VVRDEVDLAEWTARQLAGARGAPSFDQICNDRIAGFMRDRMQVSINED